MKMRERITRYDAAPMLPGNRIRNLRRRVDRARDCPTHTCPASRHLHMMAEALLRDGHYTMLNEEPEHCAATMLAVLESLWKLRARATPPAAKEA